MAGEGPKSLASAGANSGGGALLRRGAISFKSHDLGLEALVPHVRRKLGSVSNKPRLGIDDSAQNDLAQRQDDVIGKGRIGERVHQIRLQVAGAKAPGIGHQESGCLLDAVPSPSPYAGKNLLIWSVKRFDGRAERGRCVMPLSGCRRRTISGLMGTVKCHLQRLQLRRPLADP